MGVEIYLRFHWSSIVVKIHGESLKTKSKILSLSNHEELNITLNITLTEKIIQKAKIFVETNIQRKINQKSFISKSVLKSVWECMRILNQCQHAFFTRSIFTSWRTKTCSFTVLYLNECSYGNFSLVNSEFYGWKVIGSTKMV